MSAENTLAGTGYRGLAPSPDHPGRVPGLSLAIPKASPNLPGRPRRDTGPRRPGWAAAGAALARSAVAAAAVGAMVLSSHALAEETRFTYGYRGQIANESWYNGLRLDSRLNEGNRLLDLPEISNRVVGDLELRLGLGDPLDLTLRNRAFYLVDDAGANTVENTVEEAYLTARFPRDVVAELGKRNALEGVGYSFNPVDFLRTPTELTGADPDPAQRKEHRPGNYLVKLRGEIGPLTVAGLYSPELREVDSEGINEVDQFLLKVYSLVRGHDISLYLYHGTRWKGGASWATVIGQALELHAEGSLQRGSDVMVPVTVDNGPTPLFRFVQRDADDNLFARVLIGGQYTFTNGVNVIVEYYYNGEGYTDSEFSQYFRLLDAAAATAGDPRASSFLLDAARNLEAIQGQHFLFVRLSGVRLPGRVDLVAFDAFNLQDASHLVSVELSRTWGDLKVGIAYDGFLGPDRSQFGSLPVSYDFRLFAKLFF